MATVTIEKTAKRYKLRLVLAVLMLIVGVIWAACVHANAEVVNQAPNYTPPGILIASAVGLWLITKVAIWWHHG